MPLVTLEGGNKITPRQNSLTEPQRPTLRKTLGVFDGVVILIGITIGAGICSTPQIIAGYQESFYPIIALWILVVFFLGAAYALVGFMLAVDRPVEVWRSLTPVCLQRLRVPTLTVGTRNDGYGKGVANINDLYLIIAWEL